jgi:hypothetical protein
MVDYVYGGHIEAAALRVYGTELFQLADKYQMKPMKRYTEHYLSTIATTKNVIQLIKLADVHDGPVLLEVCSSHMDAAYSTTNAIGLELHEADHRQPRHHIRDSRVVCPGEGGAGAGIQAAEGDG